MLLVGLTGGIASGKTEVANEFFRLGACVIDADALARQLTRRGEPAYTEVVEYFGKRILNFNLEIDRAKWAERVFEDKDLLAKLNGIVHPLVLEEEKKRIAKIAEQDNKAIIVLDVPLLIEVEHHTDMDKVIVVDATEEERVQRLLKKGMSKSQAKARITAQLPLADKLKHADFIIDNNGALEQAYVQVRDIYKQLEKIAKFGHDPMIFS